MLAACFGRVTSGCLALWTTPVRIGFPNIFTYLQGRVAGLQISQAGINGGVARWRGGPVTFFLDEVRVSAQQIASIPMTDIAIVKAYPPPFIGASGGGGAHCHLYPPGRRSQLPSR